MMNFYLPTMFTKQGLTSFPQFTTNNKNSTIIQFYHFLSKNGLVNGNSLEIDDELMEITDCNADILTLNADDVNVLKTILN